ncbi:MAG: quinone-interacting membrane-bound oxidoreductase complex subunit QmoC [Pirellulales bacterium]|nr:quinone-interacting membrane-bound oxidoreductase complex subunit QmoC [Pirellulales bacterium]
MPTPYSVKPDRDFLRHLLDDGGEDLKKCFQCATCSVVCELSGKRQLFPRKEMISAQWGLKDRLVADPDVWLCYQCNDCSTHCPRGARPGDVMAAIRRETVIEHSVPSFLARWMSRPRYLPLLLLIPVVILGLAAMVEKAPAAGQKILYPYWWRLPHAVLIGLFGVLSVLVFVAMTVGVMRFWRAMKAADGDAARPTKSLRSSIATVLKNVLMHDQFSLCKTEHSRLLSHMAVFYGFLALSAVAVWVLIVILTAGHNPLVPGELIYPFNFWNPWRMLANLGGVAVVAGCAWMIWERLRQDKKALNTYSDWAFMATFVLVVLSGFVCEALHYLRLEPHRFAAYFGHLVLVFMLLAYLPYSKFSHTVYRIAAMVYAEYSGRNDDVPIEDTDEPKESEKSIIDQTSEKETNE